MSEVEEDERGVPSPQRSSATIGANASSPSPKLTKISRHHFSDDDSNASAGAFSIDVIESMEEEYGMFIWPCSIVLAEYVWQQRKRFLNESVVELGAGTSLPGLVAAKVGADVTLTDISSNLEVLDNMKRSCGINKLNCKVFHHTNANRCRVFGFTFAHFMVYLADIRAHVGRMGHFDDLFATVTFLLQSSPGCVFISSYHNRSGHHLIEYLMVKWGWKCTKLLDAFSFMPSSKAANLHGSIQLVEIALNNEFSE